MKPIKMIHSYTLHTPNGVMKLYNPAPLVTATQEALKQRDSTSRLNNTRAQCCELLAAARIE